MNNASHPVVNLAFWKTKPKEIDMMIPLYDALVAGDPEKKKQLDELLDWARNEARADEAFNNAGEDA